MASYNEQEETQHFVRQKEDFGCCFQFDGMPQERIRQNSDVV